MKAYYVLGKSALPPHLEGEINKIIIELRKLKTKEQVLQRVYTIITKRYQGRRLHTMLKIFDLFSSSAQDLWNRTGFMHCTNQNFLIALLLIRSGKFKESDIKRKWTLYWGLTPHQYLDIKVQKSWIKVDGWSSAYGIGIGDYARWFHTGKPK